MFVGFFGGAMPVETMFQVLAALLTVNAAFLVAVFIVGSFVLPMRRGPRENAARFLVTVVLIVTVGLFATLGGMLLVSVEGVPFQNVVFVGVLWAVTTSWFAVVILLVWGIGSAQIFLSPREAENLLTSLGETRDELANLRKRTEEKE